MNEQELNECLWQEIIARAGRQFVTHKGASFSYHIKEDRSGETSGELVIDGKLKRITRSTVLLAFHRVMELQMAHGCVSKPGKIGVYGDIWLYPVFLDIGICTRTKDEKARPLTQSKDGAAAAPGEAPAAAPGEAPGVTAAQATPAEISESVKICACCGYRTTEDFDFCPKCGTKFDA